MSKQEIATLKKEMVRMLFARAFEEAEKHKIVIMYGNKTGGKEEMKKEKVILYHEDC